MAVGRGLAILFIDQEVTGGAARLQFHPKIARSDVSAGLFLDALEARPNALCDAGLGVGGHVAPRVAASEERAVCAASFGRLYDLDAHRDEVLGTADRSSSEGLSGWRAYLRHVTGAETDEQAVAIHEKGPLAGVPAQFTVPLLIAQLAASWSPSYASERQGNGRVRSCWQSGAAQADDERAGRATASSEFGEHQSVRWCQANSPA